VPPPVFGNLVAVEIDDTYTYDVIEWSISREPVVQDCLHDRKTTSGEVSLGQRRETSDTLSGLPFNRRHTLQDAERSDWIQYIRSLNDRYLNRRTSSGFQVWTILAFMTLCLSQVLRVIPLVAADIQFRSDLLKITCLELYGGTLVSFMVLSGPVAIVYAAQHRSGYIRATTPLDAVQDYVRGCGLSVVFLVCSCLQVLASFTTHWSPFVLECSFFTVFAYCLQWTIRSRRRAIRRTKNVSSWSIFGDSLWIWIRAFMILSAALFWVLACRSSNVVALDRDGVNLLVAGLPFVGILLGLSALAFVIADSFRDSWLEKFQTDALLENMSTDAVRSGLIDGYLGRDLTSSLDQLNQSWNEAVARCLSALDGATKGYVNTATLGMDDPSLPAKLAGNRKFIDRLPENLKNNVVPAMGALSKVLDSVLEVTGLEGAGTTPQIWMFMRRFTARARESQSNITTLMKRSLNEILSETCAAAAGTERAGEVEEAVNKMRHELDRL